MDVRNKYLSLVALIGMSALVISDIELEHDKAHHAEHVEPNEYSSLFTATGLAASTVSTSTDASPPFTL